LRFYPSSGGSGRLLESTGVGIRNSNQGNFNNLGNHKINKNRASKSKEAKGSDLNTVKNFGLNTFDDFQKIKKLKNIRNGNFS